MNREEKLKITMDKLDKGIGELIDGVFEAQEKDGGLGCDVFNQISQILAIRCGQVEGFHIDHDAKAAGVKKLDAGLVLTGVKNSQENVLTDVLNGINASLKHYGHADLDAAALVLKDKIAEAEAVDKKGKVYH